MGALLRARYRTWYVAQSELPQWGEEIDTQVQTYIRACQDVILANLNWRYGSFESCRQKKLFLLSVLTFSRNSI